MATKDGRGTGPVRMSDRATQIYLRSPEFLAGREAGFNEGVNEAVAALTTELVRAGCTSDEIAHIVARIRANTRLPR